MVDKERESYMMTALQEFLVYMSEVKKASVNTVKSYQNDLTKLINHLSSQNITDLRKISETSINSYILALERKGMSPATVSRNIASIKAFVLFLIKKGKLQDDPTERMRAPKVEKRPPRILSQEQMNGLLAQPDTNTIKGIRDKAMLELLYATGIRVSELISVKVEDINLTNRFLRCRNRNKERIIPFGNMAKMALENYLQNSRNELIGNLDTNICFANLSGEPMSRQGFWKIIKYYGKAAGIEDDITPQILRNSFAVHMIENGADLQSIQEMLGHSDVAYTQIYMQKRNQKVTDIYAKAHPRA